MDKEPFELTHNQNGQVDIIDWAESENTDQIHIYNDLGVLPYSAAPALCELLNKQYKEIQELKAKIESITSLILFSGFHQFKKAIQICPNSSPPSYFIIFGFILI